MNIAKFVFVALFVASTSNAASPDHALIEMAFFKCTESKNLEGGIYGKGPFKKFGSPDAACKKNEWVKISKTEFKLLAKNWYDYDWSNDIIWWHSDADNSL